MNQVIFLTQGNIYVQISQHASYQHVCQP